MEKDSFLRDGVFEKTPAIREAPQLVNLAVFQSLQSRFGDLADGVSDMLSRQEWAAVFVILLSTLVTERIILFIFTRMGRLTSKTSTTVDDKVVLRSRRPIGNYVLLFGLFVITGILDLPVDPVDFPNVVRTVIEILVVLNTIWLFLRLTDIFGTYLFSKLARTSSRLDEQIEPIIRKTIKVFFVIVGAVYVIQALGYSISGVVAGLGIGGLAVAMAAKDTLSNFFGSIMILSDRPFRVGDWIRADQNEGVVEEIGFRSTRIRTFPKTLITIPNSVIANTAIDNFSRMPKRRVNMTVGVTYSTTADQMERLVWAIENILKNHEGVDKEFMLVNFTDFGSSSLDVLVYYFTATVLWAEHLRIRQEVNLLIMRLVDEMGLAVAFPTRTVHLVNENPSPVSRIERPIERKDVK